MKLVEKFVNDGALQLTIREVQDLGRSKSFWIGLLCVVAVLAVSAPFDSGEEFNVWQRVIYWLGISVATFFPAMLVIGTLSRRFQSAGQSGLTANLLAGVVSGVPVGIIVFCINSYIAGNDDGELKDITRLIGLCTPIATAVAGLQYLLSRGAVNPADVSGGDFAPPLLKRVNHSIRGPILSLQSQDHYVEVVTGLGSELILMRLADAIDEVSTDGMQVHRSWWVARDAVAELARSDGRHELRLKDGRQVPVSRANQKTVAAWLQH